MEKLATIDKVLFVYNIFVIAFSFTSSIYFSLQGDALQMFLFADLGALMSIVTLLKINRMTNGGDKSYEFFAQKVW